MRCYPPASALIVHRHIGSGRETSIIKMNGAHKTTYSVTKKSGLGQIHALDWCGFSLYGDQLHGGRHSVVHLSACTAPLGRVGILLIAPGPFYEFR